MLAVCPANTVFVITVAHEPFNVGIVPKVLNDPETVAPRAVAIAWSRACCSVDKATAKDSELAFCPIEAS